VNTSGTGITSKRRKVTLRNPVNYQNTGERVVVSSWLRKGGFAECVKRKLETTYLCILILEGGSGR